MAVEETPWLALLALLVREILAGIQTNTSMAEAEAVPGRQEVARVGVAEQIHTARFCLPPELAFLATSQAAAVAAGTETHTQAAVVEQAVVALGATTALMGRLVP